MFAKMVSKNPSGPQESNKISFQPKRRKKHHVCSFKCWPGSPAPQIMDSSIRLTSRGVQRYKIVKYEVCQNTQNGVCFGQGSPGLKSRIAVSDCCLFVCFHTRSPAPAGASIIGNLELIKKWVVGGV